MNPKITVGLVEDQLLFREGMKAILAYWPDVDVVFESPEGYSVLDKLRGLPAVPDVMLVDLSLPPHGGQEFGGLQVTGQLPDAHAATKILILSVHDDESFISQLIRSGAHGYLVKDCDPQEVYDAIRSVHTVGSYINPRTLKAIQRTAKSAKASAKPLSPLTRREEEVLQLVCQQYTAEEIAGKLFISTKTVNGHRNNLLQKTGSRNATGLVVYAIRHNIFKLA